MFPWKLILDITHHFANFLILGPKKNHHEKFTDSLQSINWEQELCNKTTNQSMFYFYEQLTQTSQIFPSHETSKQKEE